MKKLPIVPIVIQTCVLLIVLAALAAFYLSRPNSEVITATVTNVIQRPNVAEDGYYGIDLKDSLKREYHINASGYMNTPLSPNERNEECVTVPVVKIGDKVEFRLPKGEGNDNYDICYSVIKTGYFFHIK